VKIRRALAILARTPRLHHTKTRLAPTLGASGAIQAHVELVEDTLARLHDISVAASSLWVTEIDATTRGWASTYDIPLHAQPGGDLGKKMYGVLCSLLVDAEQACLVGTDCPDIDLAYVEAAFAALTDNDVVIGPAEDGGYGLIGLREPAADLFSGVDWGSANVLRQTLDRAAASGLRTSLQQTIWDVDTPADWQRYRQGQVD
jgi:rSAM/selenodomain-associated transferase 1